MALLYPSSRPCNPIRHRFGWSLGRIHPSHRSPEGRKRENSQVLLYRRSYIGRRGVNVKNLAAVGRIHWTRCDAEIHRRIHVVPPKKLSTGKGWIRGLQPFPYFGRLDDLIGLLPKMDFCQFTMIPAIGDNPVLRRRLTCEIVRLSRTRDCGKGRLDQT